MATALVAVCVLAAGTAPAGDEPLAQRRAPSATPSSLPVRVVLAPAGRLPPRTTVTVTAHGSERTLTRREVSVPGTVELALDGSAPWRLEAEGAAIWSLPASVRLEGAGSREVTLSVWPAGEVVASWRAPPSVPADLLALTFEGSEGPVRRVPKSTATCGVRQGDLLRWRCRVPVAQVDLRLGATGWVPKYFWGVEAPAAGVLNLGPVELEKGSSLSGWVTTTGAVTALEKLQAFLVPARPDIKVASDRERTDLRTLTTRPDQRGFFQFAGVAPGGYDLLLRGEELAPEVRRNLTVYDGREAVLVNPVQLGPPTRLEVGITPPLDPLNRAWRASLVRSYAETGRFGPPKEIVIAETGWGDWSALAPGSYRLRISDSEGSIRFDDMVNASGRGETVLVDLAGLEVEGSVRLGDEPLPAARLAFQGGEAGESIATVADDGGDFRVTLPRLGLWDIRIDSRTPRIKRTLKRIEVRKAPGGGRVTVSLPDTSVRGRVVDERRRPVPAAYVISWSAAAGEQPHGVRLDGDARFELRGIAPGTIELTAQHDDGRTSGRVRAHVAASLEGPELELVLRERLRLVGQVIDRGGRGLPGVRIIAAPAGDVFALVETVASGADGWFAAELPAGTQQANLAVYATGYAAKALPVRVDPKAPVVVDLDQEGGALVLEHDQPLPVAGFEGDFVTLFVPGAQLEGKDLRQWATLHGAPPEEGGRRWVIPNLAAGPYTACLAPMELESALRAGVGRDRHCASGVLSPLGVLRLRLPESKPERAAE